MSQSSTEITCWPLSYPIASCTVLRCVRMGADRALGAAAVSSVTSMTTLRTLDTTFGSSMTLSATLGTLPSVIVWMSSSPGGHAVHLMGEFMLLCHCSCGGCCCSWLTASAEVNINRDRHTHGLGKGAGSPDIKCMAEPWSETIKVFVLGFVLAKRGHQIGSSKGIKSVQASASSFPPAWE